MVETILAWLSAIPGLLKAAKIVAEWLGGVVEKVEKDKKKEDFKDAVEESDETKDTSKIDDMFGGSKPELPNDPAKV